MQESAGNRDRDDPFLTTRGRVRLYRYLKDTWIGTWWNEVATRLPAPKPVVWVGLYLVMGGRMLAISKCFNPTLFRWLRAFGVRPKFLDRASPHFDHAHFAPYLSVEDPKDAFFVCTREYLFNRILRSGEFGHAFLSSFYVVSLQSTKRVRYPRSDAVARIRSGMPEGLSVVAPPEPWPEDGMGYRHPYAKRHGSVVNRHRHDLLNALCTIRGQASATPEDLAACDWLYRTSEMYLLVMLDGWLKTQRRLDRLDALGRE